MPRVLVKIGPTFGFGGLQWVFVQMRGTKLNFKCIAVWFLLVNWWRVDSGYGILGSVRIDWVPDSDTGYCLFCGPDQLQSKLYRYPPYPKEVATLSVPTANLVLEMVVLWVGRLLQTQGGRQNTTDDPDKSVGRREWLKVIERERTNAVNLDDWFRGTAVQS